MILVYQFDIVLQEAVAEHFAEVKRFSNIPDVCAPKKVSIFSFLFSSVEGTYVRAYMFTSSVELN